MKMRFRIKCWSPIRRVSSTIKFFKHHVGLRSFLKVFLRMLKDICRKEKFSLNYKHPEDFTICFWQKRPQVSPIWIAYRAILVVYFFITLVLVLFKPEDDHAWYKNLIFYTNWCYILQFVTFTLALAVTVERFLKEKKEPELPPMEVMPLQYKVLWVLYTIAAPSTIVVTIIFWGLIFSPGKYRTFYYTAITHAFNSVWMILDFALCAIPSQFVHFYWVLLASFVYVLFDVIYQASGGTGTNGEIPIYRVLDWRDPKSALTTCAMQVTCIFLVHCAFCALNLLKRCKKKPSKTEEAAEE